MDKRLRQLLLDHGVSEATCDKLERGDAADDPVDRLRKLAPDCPTLVMIDHCSDLRQKISTTVADILKADGQRESAARGVELFNKGHTNGFPIDLPDFLRGLKP